MQCGANADKGNLQGGTPLIEAGQHHEIVKLLLQHGAEVNLPDAYGCTALFRANQNNHNDNYKATIALLVDSNASENIPIPYEPFGISLINNGTRYYFNFRQQGNNWRKDKNDASIMSIKIARIIANRFKEWNNDYNNYDKSANRYEVVPLVSDDKILPSSQPKKERLQDIQLIEENDDSKITDDLVKKIVLIVGVTNEKISESQAIEFYLQKNPKWRRNQVIDIRYTRRDLKEEEMTELFSFSQRIFEPSYVIVQPFALNIVNNKTGSLLRHPGAFFTFIDFIGNDFVVAWEAPIPY